MNRVALLFFFLFLFCNNSNCQSWGDSTKLNKITFYSVEQNAKFPGGLTAFYEFISNNLKAPENSKINTVLNTVKVQIYISEAGKILFARIIKDQLPELEKQKELYNKSAIDLIKQMPDWIPAVQNGYKVQSSITIPIVFID